MGYVEKNVLHGESIVYKASIHWFIFMPGIVIFSLGVYLSIIGAEGDTGGVFGSIAIIIALVSLLRAVIFKFTTELAVTSKRVIAKVGLISRNTVELNHSKVESLNVNQSILGRVFGYGTLIINGTGGGKTPIPNIVSPLEFRREAMQAIDSSQ